jgi:large subunit ribosomal protein L18
MTIKNPSERAAFRKLRTRAKIYGTPEKPRLSARRTSKHIYAQLVDDANGRTLVFASTLDESLRSSLKTGADTAAAKAVGKLVAEKARKAGIEAVVFDRGAWSYHGRIKALAEGAREAGLKF